MTKGRPGVGRVTFVVFAFAENTCWLEILITFLIALPLNSLRNRYKKVNWKKVLMFILYQLSQHVSPATE